ncbi:MAG: nucleotidyltransferase domain-containing protein [bacterium]
MQTQGYPYSQLKAELRQVVGKHIDLQNYQAFIFGSRTNDQGDDRSDIDIGIEGQSPLSVTKLANLREDLDNLPTLYSFDVVDFSTVSDSFKKTAKLAIDPLN